MAKKKKTSVYVPVMIYVGYDIEHNEDEDPIEIAQDKIHINTLAFNRGVGISEGCYVNISEPDWDKAETLELD